DVRVVSLFRLVLDVGGRDRDAALALFRSLVDLVEGHRLGQAFLGLDRRDRSGQSGLTMIDVADRSDVHVWLRTLKFGFAHFILKRVSLRYSLRRAKAGCRAQLQARDRD